MYQKTKKHSLEGKKRATKCLQLLLRNQHIKLFYLMPEHRGLQDVQDSTTASLADVKFPSVIICNINPVKQWLPKQFIFVK